MPKRVIKKLDGVCDRCGSDPPLVWDRMAKGQPLQWICKTCMHIRNTARHLSMGYQEYEKLLNAASICAICRAELPRGKKHVDIDADGDYRGIICQRCKYVVSFAKNDAKLLNGMSVYINNKRFLKGSKGGA